MENCGVKFQGAIDSLNKLESTLDDFALVSFSHNEALLSRIKMMASDPLTDEAVKKKLMSVLASWHRQFKDDPKMSVISGLWTACGGGVKVQCIANRAADMSDGQIVSPSGRFRTHRRLE